MDADELLRLLGEVQTGRLSASAAFDRLRHLPYENLGFARPDLHRPLRKGLPEVVYCQGKTPEQVIGIFETLAAHHKRVLGTRAAPELALQVQQAIPDVQYQPISRLLTLCRTEMPAPAANAPYAVVLSAGTADLPVAEEAAGTLEFVGERVYRAYDVGVTGLHRLLDQQELLQDADVVISVAGMEGALTTVVGGLVSCPVIGVPTSVGYGASFGGVAALLAMLNSCAPGVAVVNIDNGFGAALIAHAILSRVKNR